MPTPTEPTVTPPGTGRQNRRAANRGTRPRSRRGIAGVVLVGLGLALWALFALTINDEPHSYSGGATAPTHVQLDKGKQYSLGIAGGVKEMQRLGVDPATLSCMISYGPSEEPLEVAADSVDTKATNQIATFAAPRSGQAHIECRGLPPVFVDNAEDAGFDTANLWLVLGCVALTLGFPLSLSALRERLNRETPSPRDRNTIVTR